MQTWQRLSTFGRTVDYFHLFIQYMLFKTLYVLSTIVYNWNTAGGLRKTTFLLETKAMSMVQCRTFQKLVSFQKDPSLHKTSFWISSPWEGPSPNNHIRPGIQSPDFGITVDSLQKNMLVIFVCWFASYEMENLIW